MPNLPNGQLLITQEQFFQDLKWLLESPELIDRYSFPFSTLPNYPISNHPTLFDTFQQHYKRHTVGGYAESLLFSWLKHHPYVETLKHGVQVSDGNRTIGEYDFLIKHTSHGWLHVELAVKFYLLSDSPSQCGTWVGPGGKDRLDIKLSTFSRQLDLSDSDHNVHVEEKHRLGTLKGRLFYPIDSECYDIAETVAKGISKHHLRGWWCRTDKLPSHQKILSNHQWVILQKPCWLNGPIIASPSKTSYLHFEELIEVAKDSIPSTHRFLMVAGVQQPLAEPSELVKFGCIVNSQWPH